MSLSSLGLLGRKVGMMRLFTDDGDAVPVTVVDVSNNRVTQVKTQDTDGYVFAILTDSTNPPWGPWRPPTKPQWEAPEIYCADCDAVSEFWQRCETNSSHRVCGACGWCECRQARSKVAERACTVCFTRKRVDLFEPGATTCKDCA